MFASRLAPRQSRSLWSTNPIPGGCVLYLPFWAMGLRSGVFKSADPYGHTATKTGAALVNKGWYFDGVDDRIILPRSTAWESAHITVMSSFMPVQPAESNSELMANNEYGVGGFKVEFGKVAATLRFILHINNTERGGKSNVITYGNRITWAGTYDGANIRSYIDGVETGSPPAFAGSQTASTKDLHIGSNPTPARDYKGDIYIMLIWNRALSDAEIMYVHHRIKWGSF